MRYCVVIEHKIDFTSFSKIIAADSPDAALHRAQTLFEKEDGLRSKDYRVRKVIPAKDELMGVASG